MAKDATVKTVVADAKVSITGSGQIEKLEANADGITISSSTDVKDTEVADGVDKPSTSTGSSGGGGSSSSGGSSVSVADKLLTATSSAISYKYEDYTYTSQLTHTVDGKNAVVSGRYDTMETVLSGASMNDMARYLGALYRFDNGATVKSITYNQETYTWSDNLDPALKGSNWVKNPEASEAEGNTLVSVIVDEFQAGKIQDAITFTLEGTDGSALTLQYGFIVGEVTANNSDTLKAALANPSVETVKVSDDITLDEAVNVDRQVTIEVNEGTAEPERQFFHWRKSNSYQ